MAIRMQAIEFKTTTRIAEIEALVRERRGRIGASVIHGTVTARRDRPGTYLTIVETASGVAAESYGTHEVGGLVADLAALCDERPEVYDLGIGSIPEQRIGGEQAPRTRGQAPGWMT
jgi:hypothetical protein